MVKFAIQISIFANIFIFILKYLYPQTGFDMDSYYQIDFSSAKNDLLIDTKGLFRGPFLSKIVDPRINESISFVVSGERGSGKTRIWTELCAKIKESNVRHLIIEPINKEAPLLEALEVWAANTKGRSYRTFEQHFEENWSDSDTRDFVITAMISRIIREDKDIILRKVQMLDFDDRLIFATIVCLYGLKDNIIKVKEFIDALFIKELKGKNINSQKCSKMEKESVIKYVKMIDVIDREIEYKIDLLCSLMKIFDKTINTVLPIPTNPSQRSERLFTLLHETVGKTLHIPVVIAIDGIDDISIFGMRQENYENKNFSIFVQSLLPLINIASGSVTHFQIMFFIPESPATVKKQILPPWRFDKLPHIKITWPSDKLRYYAQFILYSLHHYQKRSLFSNALFKLGFWTELPDNINYFFGGKKCYDIFMEGIRGPRKFNDRMNSFLYWVNVEQENFIGKSDCSTVIRTIENEKNYK